MCLAVSRARGSCSVCTLAPRPYRVLLASASASLAVRKGSATRTGPKISSMTTLLEVLTPVIRVGG